MKVLFKNKTKYSKEIYEEFLGFHQEKYGTRYYAYTALIAIALLFCIVLQIQSKHYWIALLTIFILAYFYYIVNIFNSNFIYIVYKY